MELSIKEAAGILGKSERTVRHMAQTGRLPARRIGARWVLSRADLEEHRRGRPQDEEASGDVDEETVETVETAEAAEDEAAEVAIEPEVRPEVEPAEPRRSASPRSGGRPRPAPASPSFTVSFDSDPPADPPAAPGSRDYPNSIRELEAFAIATAILGEVSEACRDPRVDRALLGEAEAALQRFLQLLTDGVHQPDLRRKEAGLQRAQSAACAALSSLIHYNLVYPDPDLGRLAERVETHLLAALRGLREGTLRRLSWRGRVVSATEVAIERILARARGLSRGRLQDQLDSVERSLHRALQHAL